MKMVDRIATALGINLASDKSRISFSKGRVTVRTGFYWGFTGDQDQRHADRNIAKLAEKQIKVTDVDLGMQYEPFRGGDNTRQGSHYWVSFKVEV